MNASLTTHSTSEFAGGWLIFAGTVMGLAGLMRIVDAIWAFGYNGPFKLEDGVLGSNMRTYAWVWLASGIVLIVSSFFLLTRSQIARWIGLFAASMSALTAMTWMPYYPVWTLTYVAISILVFYALAAHGMREVGAH